MKNIFLLKKRSIGSLLVVFVFLTSCKKLIEIPPAPLDKLTQVQQLGDSTNIMNAVAGIYSYTAGQTTMGVAFATGQLQICNSNSADELTIGVAGSNTDLFKEYYDFGISTTNSYIANYWLAVYRNLYTINTIINTLPTNPKLSTSFANQIIGEMKLMRAFYYFNMVNQFGGVPLVLSTDYNVTALLPRASVDDVYAQIITDLTDARAKLIPAYPSAGKLRPNLYTALAYLSKVHLYRGDWQSAYNEADMVIKAQASSGQPLYTMETDLAKVFLDGSTEAIWQIPSVTPNNAANSNTGESGTFVPGNATVIPNFILSPSLLTALGVINFTTFAQSSPTDQRLAKWAGKQVIAGQTYFYPYKYKNRVATTTPIEDYIMFRLGEVYLIRAEAAAQLNNLPQALADVNVIRTRAGAGNSTANATSQTAVLDAVMKERQRELFTEWGNRWFDLKRTGTAGTVLSAVKPNWKPEAALYPVPNSQVAAAGLIQNPGY